MEKFQFNRTGRSSSSTLVGRRIQTSSCQAQSSRNQLRSVEDACASDGGLLWSSCESDVDTRVSYRSSSSGGSARISAFADALLIGTEPCQDVLFQDLQMRFVDGPPARWMQRPFTRTQMIAGLQ